MSEISPPCWKPLYDRADPALQSALEKLTRSRPTWQRLVDGHRLLASERVFNPHHSQQMMPELADPASGSKKSKRRPYWELHLDAATDAPSERGDKLWGQKQRGEA